MCNFLDQLLYPYKFYGRDMSGILFFIFASCEPLNIFSIQSCKAFNAKQFDFTFGYKALIKSDRFARDIGGYSISKKMLWDSCKKSQTTSGIALDGVDSHSH